MCKLMRVCTCKRTRVCVFCRLYVSMMDESVCKCLTSHVYICVLPCYGIPCLCIPVCVILSSCS